MIVLSLWELMQLFEQRKLAGVIEDLKKYECLCDEQTNKTVDGSAVTIPPDAMSELVKESLEEAAKLCSVAGWQDAEGTISVINSHLQYRDKRLVNHSSLSSDLRHALDALMSALWKRRFVQISPKYETYTNNDKLFGDCVRDAFPNASPDLREAGNCLSVGCGTATVFHLMRAAEWGNARLC